MVFSPAGHRPKFRFTSPEPRPQPLRHYIVLQAALHFAFRYHSTLRLNLQRPAHGAAIQGHTHVLKRLVELKADVTSVDDIGKAPLDYAIYYCHKDASEFLRAAVYDGGQTEWEKKADANKDGITTLDEIKEADDGAKHVDADQVQL